MEIGTEYIQERPIPRRIAASCNIAIPMPICADKVRIVTQANGDVTDSMFGLRLMIGTA